MSHVVGVGERVRNLNNAVLVKLEIQVSNLGVSAFFDSENVGAVSKNAFVNFGRINGRRNPVETTIFDERDGKVGDGQFVANFAVDDSITVGKRRFDIFAVAADFNSLRPFRNSNGEFNGRFIWTGDRCDSFDWAIGSAGVDGT